MRMQSPPWLREYIPVLKNQNAVATTSILLSNKRSIQNHHVAVDANSVKAGGPSGLYKHTRPMVDYNLPPRRWASNGC